MKNLSKVRIISEKQRRIISEANRKRQWTDEMRNNNRLGHIGKILSSETRKKISEKTKGRTPWNKGKLFLFKENNPNWKGGKYTEDALLRHSFQYAKWRDGVFVRDNFTCQNCGKRGDMLNADHIKPWCRFPDLRFDLNNGRTLCVDCHRLIGWSLFRENNPNNLRFLQV